MIQLYVTFLDVAFEVTQIMRQARRYVLPYFSNNYIGPGAVDIIYRTIKLKKDKQVFKCSSDTAEKFKIDLNRTPRSHFVLLARKD